MRFVKTSENTYSLNHYEYVRECYKSTFHQTIDEHKCLDFAYKQEYFNVDVPYVSTNHGKQGRRKRKLPMNEEEIEEQAYHECVTEKLCGALAKTQFQVKDGVIRHQNAVLVNVDQKCGKCSAIFRDLCLRRLHIQSNDVIELQQDIATHLDLQHLLNRVVKYNGHGPRTICLDGEYILLPAKCSFLLSDASALDPLVNFAVQKGGYDVIVLDPPWENKSAKRGKKYSWLSFGDIGKIPLRKFARNGCIVVVWVTNKQRVHKFVKNELFPSNEIQYVAEWHWVKITNSGQPVMEFSSLHKRPYETIIIGRLCNSEDVNIPSSVLISTPCTIHSHKPPLDDIISNFLTVEEPQCLELFARNLKPHWTSWGNEVLEMQSIKHFDSSNIKAESSIPVTAVEKDLS